MRVISNNESDLFNYTHTNYLGTGTISYLTADPTVKLGLTNWIDFEVDFNGYLNTADTQQSEWRAHQQ